MPLSGTGIDTTVTAAPESLPQAPRDYWAMSTKRL